MEVLIVHPPSPPGVVLDQAEGRLAHRAPPWSSLCLLAFLRQRTRHRGLFFDARMQRRWEHQLEALLKDPVRECQLVVVECSRHELLAARAVAEAVRRMRPGVPLVGFGDAPTLAPGRFLEDSGFDFGIAGDPEPALRHLLDNFHISLRRQRIAGLIQPGMGIPAPMWVGDLRTLSSAEWSDLQWVDYESPAYPGGLRVDVHFSRGAGGHKIAGLVRPGNAPLRLWPQDRLVDTLQTCSQLGVAEVHFDDPPEVWDEGRLDEWLQRLERTRNSQDWSLRLFALPLDEHYCARLVSNRCRRIEWLVPTCDPTMASDCGFDMPPARAMREVMAWFRARGIQSDLVFWAGCAAEPRGEAGRILRMLRSLDYPSFGLEVHPLTAPYEERLTEIVGSIRRSLALSPTRRMRLLRSRWRRLRIAFDEEHRDPASHQAGPPG